MFSAFTLAEVLITLVIIGVIAAITVPTLMAHQKKIELITQFKRGYSMLSNGFKLAMAKDGVTRLSDTTLFNSINGENTKDETEQSEFLKQFSTIFTEMKSYNVSETPENMYIKYKNLSGAGNFDPLEYSRMSFYLNNGSIVYGMFFKETTDGSYVNGFASKKTIGNIFIDINGAKKPNTIGRDLFYFFLYDDGRLIPYGAKEYNEGLYWVTNNYCKSGDAGLQSNLACTSRIIDEGWEMNY